MPKLHVFLVRLEQTRVIASVLRMTRQQMRVALIA
jgi:hypothetical protein